LREAATYGVRALLLLRHKSMLSSRPSEQSERIAGTHIAEPLSMGPGSAPRFAWLGRDDSGEILTSRPKVS